MSRSEIRLQLAREAVVALGADLDAFELALKSPGSFVDLISACGKLLGGVRFQHRKLEHFLQPKTPKRTDR